MSNSLLLQRVGLVGCYETCCLSHFSAQPLHMKSIRPLCSHQLRFGNHPVYFWRLAGAQRRELSTTPSTKINFFTMRCFNHIAQFEPGVPVMENFGHQKNNKAYYINLLLRVLIILPHVSLAFFFLLIGTYQDIYHKTFLTGET